MNIKKITKAAIVLILGSTAITGFAASPWGHKQQRRHYEMHRAERHADHQQFKADRALSRGDIGSYFRHENHAQQLQEKAHYLKHKIHRTNRHWENRHSYCGRHYCY